LDASLHVRELLHIGGQSRGAHDGTRRRDAAGARGPLRPRRRLHRRAAAGLLPASPQRRRPGAPAAGRGGRGRGCDVHRAHRRARLCDGADDASSLRQRDEANQLPGLSHRHAGLQDLLHVGRAGHAAPTGVLRHAGIRFGLSGYGERARVVARHCLQWRAWASAGASGRFLCPLPRVDDGRRQGTAWQAVSARQARQELAGVGHVAARCARPGRGCAAARARVSALWHGSWWGNVEAPVQREQLRRHRLGRPSLRLCCAVGPV